MRSRLSHHRIRKHPIAPRLPGPRRASDSRLARPGPRVIIVATVPFEDLDDQCTRLQRDASAVGVMVVDKDGALLGRAGRIAQLPEPIIDATADLVVDCLGAVARNELLDGDDLVAELEDLSACAAPLGPKAVLVVVFDEGSTLALVRMRMKRARDVLLRSISEP